jgi:hypothetical protein
VVLCGIFDPPSVASFLPFLLTIWTVSKSSNYDEMKMSWEIKSIHDDFSFQIVMVVDNSIFIDNLDCFKVFKL